MLDPIHDYVGIPKNKLVPPNSLFGVEIEMEGQDLLSSGYASPSWKVVPDGSLRGESQEYVFSQPLPFDASISAVNALYSDFTTARCKLSPSIRCGVHVHLNVQRLNIVQLMNFITLYLMFEEVLCDYCGPNRVGNMFCLRTKDAEYFLYALREAAKSNSFQVFQTDRLRYCALNLKSLFKFGSIEFRTLSTPTTPGKIVDWISIIHSLYQYSLTLTTPVDVLSLYSDKHEEYLLREVFKSHSDSLMTSGLDKKIKCGFRYARLLAKTVDWNSYTVEPKVDNPFKKVAAKVCPDKRVVPTSPTRVYNERGNSLTQNTPRESRITIPLNASAYEQLVRDLSEPTPEPAPDNNNENTNGSVAALHNLWVRRTDTQYYQNLSGTFNSTNPPRPNPSISALQRGPNPVRTTRGRR